MAEANKKQNIFKRIARWFREMKSELKKIVWCSKSQLLNNTLVVIACVVVVGIFIWIFDPVAEIIVNGIYSVITKLMA